MSTERKILPLRQDFENFQALLAYVAETPGAIGFVGIVRYEDGRVEPVSHNVDASTFAYCANILDEIGMCEGRGEEF